MDVRNAPSAAVGPGVGEGVAGGGGEAPVVAVGVQGQLEDPEGALLADLAVGGDGPLEGVVWPAARPSDELPQAGGIGPALRVLAGEALVDVAVAGQDDVGAGRLQIGPEGRHLPVAGDELA